MIDLRVFALQSASGRRIHASQHVQSLTVPISRAHHTLKHKTKIALTRHPDGRYTWTTPTGFTRDNDPPPF